MVLGSHVLIVQLIHGPSITTGTHDAKYATRTHCINNVVLANTMLDAIARPLHALTAQKKLGVIRGNTSKKAAGNVCTGMSTLVKPAAHVIIS